MTALEKKKNREGYGFSYTDSLFQDSFDSHRTTGGGDASDGETAVDADLYSETEFPPGHASPRPNAGVNLFQPSFDGLLSTNLIVVRDIGSFHIARPERKFKCTVANQEITIYMQHLAKGLMAYTESQDVSSNLLERMERMYMAAMKEPGNTKKLSQDLVLQSAKKLRDFLVKVKKERIATGEFKSYVQHEIEWAQWLVKASENGVMHAKTGECKCSAEWED